MVEFVEEFITGEEEESFGLSADLKLCLSQRTDAVRFSRSLDGISFFVFVLLQKQTQVIVSDLYLIRKALVSHLPAT